MSKATSLAASSQLAKKIEKDIEQSGLPLELYVLNVCSTRNTGRMPNVRYEHQGQLREIDLHASFETIRSNGGEACRPQHTCTDLIIECKKSKDKPWVFFSSSAYHFDDVLVFLNTAVRLEVE